MATVTESQKKNVRCEARKWLRENGHDGIADSIDEIMNEWKRKQIKTRRNWWDILAGDANGNPRMVSGREFPILVAAQQRQRIPVTDSAIKGKREAGSKLKKMRQARWNRKNRKAKP